LFTRLDISPTISQFENFDTENWNNAELIERHSSKIKGVISCFDRIILTGTFPGICYAQGMSAFLTPRAFVYSTSHNGPTPARRNPCKCRKGRQRQWFGNRFYSQKEFPKGKPNQRYSQTTGFASWACAYLSAMEVCTAYKPWYNKKTRNTSLKTVPGKCLHYYFYFIHASWDCVI